MPHFETHLRVVSAFIMREIATRYGRNPGGYLWAFLDPLSFIALMSFLLRSFGHLPALGESFTLFYATGVLGFNFYKNMETYISSSISTNRALMSYPQVAPIDAVVARLSLQGVTSVVVAIVIIGGSLYTVPHPIHLGWTHIFDAILFAWTLALGVGLTNCVLFFRFPLYEKIFGIVMRPLFLLSGVFYMPASMPRPFRDYILCNPVSHIVMLFRWAFYGDPAARGLDIWYLGETSFSMLFVGLFIFTMWPVARQRIS